MEPLELVALLAAFIPLASMVSVELGVTVALLELTLGVTAGDVSSLSGLNPGLIATTQFSLLVTVVVLSAVAPAVAERWFPPDAVRTCSSAEEH